jgi:hypothetical protein
MIYILVAICVNTNYNVTTVNTSVLAFRSAKLCIKNVEANRKVMYLSCQQLDIQCKERDLGK